MLFACLGATPNNHRMSVNGNLYALILDDPIRQSFRSDEPRKERKTTRTALVFDLRTYTPKDEFKVTFKRIGDFDIATIPPSQLRARKRPTEGALPFADTLATVTQVYVVNLSQETPSTLGWKYLHRLFPNATRPGRSISMIPLGRTDWRPIAEEDRDRRFILDVEQTGLVERGEKVKIEPLTLFLFRSRTEGGPASIIVTGEIMGRHFAFLLGDPAMRDFFVRDRVEQYMDETGVGLEQRPTDENGVERPSLQHLSTGRWHAFYARCAAMNSSPPVKRLAAGET